MFDFLNSISSAAGGQTACGCIWDSPHFRCAHEHRWTFPEATAVSPTPAGAQHQTLIPPALCRDAATQPCHFALLKPVLPLSKLVLAGVGNLFWVCAGNSVANSEMF